MFETLKTARYVIGAYFRTSRAVKAARNLPEEEQWQAGYDCLRPECIGLMKTTGSRIVYHGLENLPEEGGALFVGNHQSYMDIPVLLSVMLFPTAFIAKEELLKVPMIGKLLKFIGCVPINRDDLRGTLNNMKEASRRMQNGLNMVVFPEGHRSIGGPMRPFHRGSIRCATDIGAKIVPFRLENNYKIFEGNKGIKIKPSDVDVYFGKAIDTSTMTHKEKRELGEKMEQIVKDLI